MRALFRVVDVETTGMDAAVDGIVEIGCIDVLVDHWNTVTKQKPSALLCNPGLPIPAPARAVHHISPAMVEHAPPAAQLAHKLTHEWPAIAGGSLDFCFVAHNAAFDRPFVERAGGIPLTLNVPWLCTWRLAKHLYPGAPSWKNEVLRYWLFPDLELEGLPHRAAHDVDVTSRLLEDMLARIHLRSSSPINTVEQLVAFAESAVFLTGVVGFGKHFDKAWPWVAEHDVSYLHWMRREGIEAWDKDQWHTVHRLLGYPTPGKDPEQLAL